MKTKRKAGRPKGSLSRTTVEMRSFLQDVVNANTDAIDLILSGKQDIEGLTELDKLKLRIDFTKAILPYVLPRRNENTLSLDESTTQMVAGSINKLNNLFD